LETKTPALVAALAERRFRKRLAALAVDTNAATKEGVREMSSFIIFFPSGLPNRGGDCPQVHYNRLRKNVQVNYARDTGCLFRCQRKGTSGFQPHKKSYRPT
jgi:hypothetical protein